jgi:hypothetical protein
MKGHNRNKETKKKKGTGKERVLVTGLVQDKVEKGPEKRAKACRLGSGRAETIALPPFPESKRENEGADRRAVTWRRPQRRRAR